jgi:hypothetical protein
MKADVALRLLAVLFAGRGAMNVAKRFGTGSGLVFFGKLLPPDTLLAPLLGLAMIVYAWGLWTHAAWAIPLGVAYAILATANLLLFPVFETMPDRIPMWLYGIYVVGGIALSWGSVWLLRHATLHSKAR